MWYRLWLSLYEKAVISIKEKTCVARRQKTFTTTLLNLNEPAGLIRTGERELAFCSNPLSAVPQSYIIHFLSFSDKKKGRRNSNVHIKIGVFERKCNFLWMNDDEIFHMEISWRVKTARNVGSKTLISSREEKKSIQANLLFLNYYKHWCYFKLANLYNIISRLR